MGYKGAVAVLQDSFYRLLGRRLSEARRAANVSQIRLADSVGISRSSLANIEAGRQPIYLHVLVGVAEQLGKSLMELVPGVQSIDPRTEKNFKKLVASKQHWIIKVLQSPAQHEKGTNGTKVLVSTAKGERAAKARSRKKGTGPHRETGFSPESENKVRTVLG